VTRGIRICVLLAALVAADAALACRCPQRTLATYFAGAELVFIGRATATWEVAGAPGHRAAQFHVHGKPYKGDPDALKYLATALTSASCGYDVQAGHIVLVFASRQKPGDEVAWFDTCNGTRSFDPQTPAGVQGFVDVPAAEILPRLSHLRASAGQSDPRTTQTPRLPVPGDPRARLVGLLELRREIAATPVAEVSVTAYAAPAPDAARVAVIRDARDVVTREYDYEGPGAVVEEQRGEWFRIALASGKSVWVRASDCGPFYPLAELVVNRLTYLNAHWDGWVWPSAGAGYPQTAPRNPGREQPVNIVAAEKIGDSLWLQVEVLDGDPCDGKPAKVVHGGWVPAYTPDGEPIAWFYSRGC
jgi:hypothetical protein